MRKTPHAPDVELVLHPKFSFGPNPDSSPDPEHGYDIEPPRDPG
jgi:hypothetical protein